MLKYVIQSGLNKNIKKDPLRAVSISMFIYVHV